MNYRVVFGFCGVAVCLACASGISQELPSATNILNRVLARASQVASGQNAEPYCYSQRRLVQVLNATGEVIDSTEKRYEVVLIRGWPFTRLVQVQGKRLSEAELLREERREEEFRAKVSGNDFQQRKAKKEAWLTPDLLARYDFNVVSNDVCQSRRTLVLTFKAKPTNPEKSTQDRILNRFAGRLWIDSEEAEVARVDAYLTGEVSLGWLGALGSLNECSLTLYRQRMPESVWVNTKQTALLIGRKLFASMRYRTVEESSDFRPAPNITSGGLAPGQMSHN